MTDPLALAAPARLNLTEYEIQAIDSDVNVADGHSRQPLTEGQRGIVDAMPHLFREAWRRPLQDLEEEAHAAYFALLGQERAPVGSRRILSAYSSSVAMDILSRCLASAGAAVGLIHPTFDNIPDLLRGRGVPLVPWPEAEVATGEPPAGLRQGDAVFVTTPNNPTGTVVEPSLLRCVAERCRERDLLLVLDTSFRGFDPRAWYDHYALLDEVGAPYVVIEDTGKLWPALELKLGFIVFSPKVQLDLKKVYSDLLLSASPFIMRLVTELAADAADGGLADLHGLIANNRRALLDAVAPAGLSTPDPGSRVSVARITVLRRNAEAVTRALALEGIHVLPGGPFHWADPREGEAYVRVALARAPAVIRHAAERLAAVADDMELV